MTQHQRPAGLDLAARSRARRRAAQAVYAWQVGGNPMSHVIEEFRHEQDMEIAERFTSEIHFARAEGSVYWLGGSRRCWGGVVHGSRPSWEQSLYCHLVTSRVAVAGE